MGGSYRASSDSRIKNDHYPTPWSLVHQLLDVEEFEGYILEPCSGEHKSIAKYLRSAGRNVVDYDLFYGREDERYDFLTEPGHFESIITNPPYRLSIEFIETAYRVSDKFAFLLPLDYLHGKLRYDRLWLNGLRPKRIYTFVRRPLFDGTLRNDGKYNTGSTTFSWFVYSGKFWGLPEMDIIDNSKYIIRKRDRE